METQIIDLAGDGGGTQIIGESTTDTGVNFTGGLLQLHEVVAGWEVERKLDTLSGEADIYIAAKDGVQGIIKYYRSVAKPKTEILEKIKGLNHPDIVNVYDYGIYNDRFYEIMEYAAGGALDSRSPDGSYRYLPLTEEEVITAKVTGPYFEGRADRNASGFCLGAVFCWGNTGWLDTGCFPGGHHIQGAARKPYTPRFMNLAKLF